MGSLCAGIEAGGVVMRGVVNKKEEHKPSQSYAEAMSEWAAARDAERTLMSKSRNTLLQPDPLSSLPARLIGYLWRLGVVVLIGAAVYFLLLKTHMKSEAFSRLVAEGAARQLQAEKVELSPFRWRKDLASARTLTAQGGPQSFFKTLEAESVDFRLPLSMALRKKWELKHIGIDILRAELRSGGLGGATNVSLSPLETEVLPDGVATPPARLKVGPAMRLDQETTPEPQKAASGRRVLDLRMHKDGFGVNPNFDLLTIGQVEVGRADLKWGLTELTRGSLRQAALLATPEAEGRWHIAVSAGQFQQNWLRDFSVKRLDIRYTGASLDFQDGVLEVGESSSTLSGSVTVEQTPRVNLKLHSQSLPLHHFLDEPVKSWLRLAASGPILIQGSLNLASGVTTSAELKIESGSLRQIPVLNTLAVLTGRGRFRDLEVTGGFVKFTTAQGRLEVQTFELQAGADVIVRGSSSWQHGQLGGNAQLGMRKEYAQRLPAAVQQAFFREDDAGWLWLEIPVDGPVESLTKPLSNKLAAAYQEATRR